MRFLRFGTNTQVAVTVPQPNTPLTSISCSTNQCSANSTYFEPPIPPAPKRKCRPCQKERPAGSIHGRRPKLAIRRRRGWSCAGGWIRVAVRGAITIVRRRARGLIYGLLHLAGLVEVVS